jgi:hypothetical protein
MKAILGALAVVCIGSVTAHAQVPVRGHFNEGRYVQPHHRSLPDHSYNNNWSTRPNVNPYTFERGTRLPTWDDRPSHRSSFGVSPLEMSPMRPSSSMMRSSLYGR